MSEDERQKSELVVIRVRNKAKFRYISHGF